MELTGKDAVRELFMQRLDTAGLKRPKVCKTEADFEAMRRRLVEFLAYLSAPSIVTLADQVLMIADGKTRDQWPAEIYIRQMAEALERRPAEDAPIVKSWLASVEGPRALLAGHAVEMLRHLRKRLRPLMPHDRTLITQEAAENNRTRQLIAERQRHGIDRSEDRAWLSAYEADLREVHAIIEHAARTREEKQTVGAEQ